MGGRRGESFRQMRRHGDGVTMGKGARDWSQAAFTGYGLEGCVEAKSHHITTTPTQSNRPLCNIIHYVVLVYIHNLERHYSVR